MNSGESNITVPGYIISSAATATTSIGYADSAEGTVALPANTIELKYTLYGDTGLTGTVGFTDFMRMTQHFTTTSGATWSQGDFNYDGAVDTSDFNLLKPNYGVALPAPVPGMTPIFAEPVASALQTKPSTDSGQDGYASSTGAASLLNMKKHPTKVRSVKKYR